MTGKIRQKLSVIVLPHGQGLDLPQYQSDGAAGLDLLAATAESAPIVIASGARALVPTGLTMQIPHGFEGQVRPRSGLAAKFGVTLLNTPGTIDSDYRGEVGVILINLGKEPFRNERGMRIAQMVVARHARAVWREVPALDETARGAGGFGSTGVVAGSSKRA